MSYKNVSITWEVYRRFLEESGIKDEVTKILHMIWEQPEKPPYLEHFVRKHFGGGRMNAPNIALVKKDLARKKEIVMQLRNRNKKLKEILGSYESPIVGHLKEGGSRSVNPDPNQTLQGGSADLELADYIN